MLKEPTRPSEFEVQAWLWSELRSLGFNVRGEVKYRLDGGKHSPRKPYCRFDLAEFRDGEIVGVIEVKSAPIKHKSVGGWKDTRQGRRYLSLPIPLHVVYGMADAERLVERARERCAIFDEDG